MTSNKLSFGNKRSAVWVMIVLFGTLVASCKKDTTTIIGPPSVSIAEVGLNNSKVAYAGNDLHLNAKIDAPGKIATVKLQITLAETNYGWDFVKTFTTPYAGIKNADFHEHIDVPENARPGLYNLLILVKDDLGNRAESQVNFEVVKDASLPGLTGISLTPSGTSLGIKGAISAPNKIEKLVVEIQSSAWTKEFVLNDPSMVGQTSFQLNKSIDITGAPAGHYHINITLVDKAGKSIGYHDHFDK